MVRSPEEITPQPEATKLGGADALAILDSGVRGAGTHPRHRALAMVEAAGGVNGKRAVHRLSRVEQCANLRVPAAMRSHAKIYEKNAAECEREAACATTPALKSKYRGVAKQWREMAEQKKRSVVRKAKKSSRAASAS
jgi:hypothetical protein